MELTSAKKKLMLAAILTSGLTLVFSQASWADPASKPEPQYQQAEMPCLTLKKPEMRKAHEKFLTDTVVLRKELAEKKAVLHALMKAGTPDTVKVAQAAGEVFELKEKLRVKASEAGLPMHRAMWQRGGGHGHRYMNHDAPPCITMP